VLERQPGTRYVVDGGRLLAERPTWFEKEKRTAPLVWPIWVPTANYGVPLLAAPPPPSPGRTVGRNDPCPCGSGRKYKHCCLGVAGGGERSSCEAAPEDRT